MAQRKLFYFVKLPYILLTSTTSYELQLIFTCYLFYTGFLLDPQKPSYFRYEESQNLLPVHGAYLDPYCPDDSATQIYT